MQTDCQMAFLMVEIFFQFGQNSYAGDRYPLRTPGKTPVGGQHGYGLGNLGIVVQRLSHPHENSVGKPVGVVDGDELVEYVGYLQMAVEAAPARHTELAVHTASGLGRYAECTAVPVRDHHGFDGGTFRLEKILEGAVAAFRLPCGGGDA